MNSKAEAVFESIYIMIISNIQKSLGKGSSWIIDSAIDCIINISKYNPIAGYTFSLVILNY